jgi:cell division control protein 24
MASVAGRKKSIVSTSGIQIDTPVGNNTLLNKAASQSTSLYQQCSQLRIRLLRIKGFDYYFSLASEATDSRRSTDPVTHVWDLFTLGISLCYIADLLPANQGFTKINNSSFDSEQYEANPDRAKKRAIAHFAMEIKRKIANAIPGCETFTVTDLWDRNSTDGLVKVVHTVTAIVNHLPPEAFEELPPSTPPLSAHDSMDSIPDSLPVQDAARQNIVREIVETERKYVQDLEVMQKYSNALYQNNIIDQDTIHLLFPNLNNLLNFQRKFLIRLESTAELPWAEQRWGQGFIDNEEEFVVYEPYCANYTNASELMLAHEQSLAALNDLINVKGELPAFLIKPVQRVCKYPLLLDSLVKATSATTYPHFEELKKGSEAAKRIADRINEAQRRAENDQTVKNLQARVEDWKGHHIANFGELLLDDIFLVTKSDVDREYHVFLFEKIVLCCKEVPPNAQNLSRKGAKSNSLLKKQSTPFPSPMGGPIPSQKKSTPLVLKGRIFLGNVTQAVPVVAKVTGASGVPTHYPLQVWWKGDDDLEFFTLRCRREDQMRQWDSQINRLIKDLAQRKQMERSCLSRIAMPNGAAALSHVGSTSQMPSMQANQTYPPMSASRGRYPRNTYSPANSDAESISPSAIIGSYASTGPLGFSQQDAFEIDPDEDDLEDYPYTSSFASSGRGTPMTAGPRSALSDRDSMASYDSNGHWRAAHASSRPITPRLQSDPLGNLSFRGSRPQLRSQFSSTRLKSSYNESGEYSPASQSQSQSPVPPHAQLSRSRSASQPTAYVPKQHLPPIPSATQPQWSRDRSNTNMSGATTGSSSKRGSGSSQSTGDSSDYSPNSSSPVTPYGSSDSSLGGVALKTSRSQLFESMASGGMSGNNYHALPVKVKIYFHEDVFVIEVPRHTEYERLVEKIGRKIRLCGPRRDDGPLRVKYRDEDGDMVSLGSTEDVQMAFSEYRPGSQVVLFVT